MAKNSLRNKLVHFFGLQTPAARLVAFSSTTALLYLISFETLSRGPSLSLWANLNIPSPSIGLTRAYWYLIHGRFDEAWDMNHLIFAVVFIIICIVVVDTSKIIAIRKLLNRK